MKGERCVRYEVKAVMRSCVSHFLCQVGCAHDVCLPQQLGPHLCYLDVSARRRLGVLVIGAIAISLSVAVLGSNKDGGIGVRSVLLRVSWRDRVFRNYPRHSNFRRPGGIPAAGIEPASPPEIEFNGQRPM